MRYVLFVIVLSLSACVKIEDDFSYRPKFVVEGMIEVNNFPHVKVTHNMPINYPINKEQLEELIIRWATVKVSTDNEEEILTLTKDSLTFPYYYYRGSQLKGQPGKKYKLTVQYNDIILKSETEIPLSSLTIDSVSFKKVEENKRQPTIYFNNVQPGNYRFFITKEDQNDFYTTSPKGFQVVNNSKDAVFSFDLIRNKSFLESNDTISNYHDIGQSMRIKVANVTDETYKILSALSQQGIAYSFINFSENFVGNIDGPAIGIWYGAHQTIYKIDAVKK